MQPVLCAGGYPIPITKKGRHEIVAIVATVNDTTAASRLTLLDSEDYRIVDDGNDLQYKDKRRLIFDQKGMANADATLGVVFPEPLKVIHGFTITGATTNLVAGKTFIYTR